MTTSNQCDNARAVVWSIILLVLSLLSVMVWLVKGSNFWLGVVCGSLSVVMFLLLFIVAYRKTASNEAAVSKVVEKECHCVWAACKFRELEASAFTRPTFSIVCITNDKVDKSQASWSLVSTLDRRLSAGISCPNTSNTCACCLGDYHMDADIAVLPCGHVYHPDCIARWCFTSDKHISCPMCRESFEHVPETIMAI
ncbi:ATL31 [Symbiodinium natans]|uniref:ATL31 protein n=1 Tax=Symbiodinium natans TaxID=878477 RepID=A0A812VAN4_9DINO|nr:ATL31 [Symbiodinium natans]